MSDTDIEFVPFPKIPRLRREVVITEKIDGTNAAVRITEDGRVFAQSRKRFITPEADNFGFATWVYLNAPSLQRLGPGIHFGEWWGQGIQRGYGLDEKRFSLFNTGRWNDENTPECVSVVPVLGYGSFDSEFIDGTLEGLRKSGSIAAPGFMRPEGIVVYHLASGHTYKVLLENDSQPKGLAA